MKNANSFYQKPKDAVLVFADGSKFYGYGIGNYGSTIGEICFNTSITGYQEILTDPSYSGQIINFTFPHIGNIGVNGNDIEAKKVRANGLIIRELITSPSNYRATNSFNDWLKINSLTGICGVDTRKITKKIRQQGAKNVAIIFDKNLDAQNINKTYDQIRGSIDLAGVELASLASENKSYDWNNEAKWNHENNNFNKTNNKLFKIVAIDYGAKLNILRCLADVGADIAVVPANAKFEDIIKHQPDGVFLSNGPGDPYETGKYAISTIKKFLKTTFRCLEFAWDINCLHYRSEPRR